MAGPNEEEGEERLTYDLENTGDHSKGESVRFREDDLTQETKRKIGDYISRETKEANNNPSLNPEPVERSIQGENGKPAPIETGGEKGSVDETYLDRFEDTPGQGGVIEFENLSGGDQFPFETIPGKSNIEESEGVKKGRTVIGEFSRQNGSEFLNQAVDQLQDNSNNLFSQNQFIPQDADGTPSESDAATGQHVIQDQLGSHQLAETADNQNRVSIDDMKNLGCKLLLEASGEQFVPDDPNEIEDILASRATGAVAPGLARLGLRIPHSRFSTNEVLDAGTNNERNTLSGPQQPSYGNPYNHLFPFDSIAAGASSAAVGSLLSLTISKMMEALASLLEFDPAKIVGDNSLEDVSYEEARRNLLGKYSRESSPLDETTSSSFLSFNKTSLIIETQGDYSNAVQRGAAIFFGNPVEGSFFTESAKRITESPGFYNGILRSLIQAITDPFLEIGQIIGGVFGQDLRGSAGGLGLTSAMDVKPNIGPPQDPANIASAINIIRESKLLKFMNILANIGDIAIATENGQFQSSIDETDDAIVSEVDGETVPNPASLIKKNRLSENLSGFEGSMAWGTNTIRSMYIAPTRLAAAESDFRGKASNTTQYMANKNVKQTTTNRIDGEMVDQLERELEAAYMPFYFHDLRTNEIISFHAFIENISDSFVPQYEESQGFGRIGKVHKYKNVDRELSVNFKIVATNENDFSEMWHKINKLTMLTFPQYTLGRKLNNTDQQGNEQRFVQPFSQLFASSPMVRMRLGDLIKTNFSEFDLSRLFGVGNRHFKVSEQGDQEFNVARSKALKRIKKDILKRYKEYNFQPLDRFKVDNKLKQIGSRDSKAGLKFVPQTVNTGLQRAGISPGNQQGVPANSIPDGTTVRVLNPTQKPKEYVVQFEPPLPGSDTTTFSVDFAGQPANLVMPDEETVDQAAEKQLATQFPSLVDLNAKDEADESVRQFFSSRGEQSNPIFKSFESSRGEGLAGFISNLQFDYNQSVWETEGLNHRAPMMTTVNLTFSPVYDINPGVDAHGAMIGPPYNVGSIMQLLKMRKKGELNEEQARYMALKGQAQTKNSSEE